MITLNTHIYIHIWRASFHVAIVSRDGIHQETGKHKCIGHTVTAKRSAQWAATLLAMHNEKNVVELYSNYFCFFKIWDYAIIILLLLFFFPSKSLSYNYYNSFSNLWSVFHEFWYRHICIYIKFLNKGLWSLVLKGTFKIQLPHLRLRKHPQRLGRKSVRTGGSGRLMWDFCLLAMS